MQWLTVLLCDHVIIIDNRDFKQAIHLPLVRRNKFVLIPLGIPESDVAFLSRKEARAALVEKTDIHPIPNSVVIGTIAELTKNKGLEYLVDALAKIRNNAPKTHSLHLIIIGDGEDRKKLEEKIAHEGLFGVISLAGFIPNAADYLKLFDLFVLPSLKEGLPYTIIEAMHAGVPIIGTRVGGVPDLVENETNGLIVPPKNSDALAAALQRLIEDKKLANKFVTESMRKIETKFSFGLMFQRTLILYRSTL